MQYQILIIKLRFLKRRSSTHLIYISWRANKRCWTWYLIIIIWSSHFNWNCLFFNKSRGINPSPMSTLPRNTKVRGQMRVEDNFNQVTSKLTPNSYTVREVWTNRKTVSIGRLHTLCYPSRIYNHSTGSLRPSKACNSAIWGKKCSLWVFQTWLAWSGVMYCPSWMWEINNVKSI